MSIRRLAAVLALLAALSAAPVASAQYAFDWELPAEQAVVRDFFVLHDFMTEFTNTAAVTDSFRVQLFKDMSANWQATLCEGPICYPPFYVDHTFVLGPGESTNLDFAITPVIDAGTGVSTAIVTSLNDPAVTATRSFRVISAGLEVLVVDADPALAAAGYFTDALATAGLTHASWNVEEMGKLALPDLEFFDAVVWSAGTAPLAMDAADMTMLDAYVFGGGNLYVSSQNLARIYVDPGSPFATDASRAFFHETLSTDYVADNAMTPNVEGAPADPWFFGLMLLTTGGDGASNNSSPDVLAPISGGVTGMIYEWGQTAGIRGAYGQGLTFYSGFSFEAVSNAADRAELMQVIVGDWLLPRPANATDDLPALTMPRPRAVPNPFNPRTEIRFTVAGAEAVPARIAIHDARGRAVRTIDLGPTPPGERRVVFDGRDDRGRTLPAGLYLALVRAGDTSGTVKMTLAK